MLRDEFLGVPIVHGGGDARAADPEVDFLFLDDFEEVLGVVAVARGSLYSRQTVEPRYCFGEAAAYGDVVGLEVCSDDIMAGLVEDPGQCQPFGHAQPGDEDCFWSEASRLADAPAGAVVRLEAL